MKIVSKKGNPYLISTVFTHIQLLDPIFNTKKETATSTTEENELTKFTPLVELLINNKSFVNKKLDSFYSLLTLEKIFKISICAKCESCSSNITKEKACSFVGCHIPVSERKAIISCSAVFHMDDDTYSASIFVNDLTVCKNFFFMLSDEEWDLILKTVEHKGELLFLRNNINIAANDTADIHTATATCFNILCETYFLSNFAQYQCKLRPFAENNLQPSWNDNKLNFICLEAEPVCRSQECKTVST